MHPSNGTLSDPSSQRPTGTSIFLIVWTGQAISLLGSAMTWFAFTIWAWQATEQATTLALVEFFLFGPILLLSPLAGALVDRWNRKLILIVSDLAAGLSTIAIFALYVTGHLQIWHLYVAAAFAGAFQAFQFPAYSAAVTMILPKDQYARAESMIWLVQSSATLFAPPLAALLLGVIDVTGIMLIDIFTFLAAIGTLAWVHIPQPAPTEAGRQGRGSLWQESLYGFRYIFERPRLLGLQLIFAASNLLDSFAFALIAPMILARTGNNEIMLGSVQSAAALGGIVGGIAISVWGGPRRRIHGILIGWTLAHLLGTLPLGLGRGLVVWAVASFCSALFTPLINGSDQAIWQSKVAPDVQGRVFAIRQMISDMMIPIALLLAGPLADNILEPAMQPGGSLVTHFSWLVGTGPGAGMALIIVFAGLLGIVIALGGYTFYAVRNVEDLPDYEQESALPAESPA